MSKYTFPEALSLLLDKKTKFIKREPSDGDWWKDRFVYIKKTKNMRFFVIEDQYYGDLSPWTPLHQDMFANDWEIDD